MENLKEYAHVKEAADMLGVSPMTLRNWDRSGKLKPVRNPINSYRLYKRSDLKKLLDSINQGSHS